MLSSNRGSIYETPVLESLPMKLILLAFMTLLSQGFALDKKSIRKLAEEPHSRENLMEELKIYPEAREYKVSLKIGFPGKEPGEGSKARVKEKTVRGRYLVSEIQVEGMEAPMVMVTTYEKKSDTYKKWVLGPEEVVHEWTGVADRKARTIAWTTTRPLGEPPTTVLSIESHSDDKTTWQETFLQDGKVIQFIRGEAVKTK